MYAIATLCSAALPHVLRLFVINEDEAKSKATYLVGWKHALITGSSILTLGEPVPVVSSYSDDVANTEFNFTTLFWNVALNRYDLVG